MRGMFMSKTTGRIYGSEEEYLNQVIIPAFERIRRYSKQSGKGDDTQITSRASLMEYIEDVTGSSNRGLANEIIKTDVYLDHVEENRADRIEKRQEERIEKAHPVSVNRERAKKEGLVFIGRTKKGWLYAYDFKKKKSVSPKKYPI